MLITRAIALPGRSELEAAEEAQALGAADDAAGSRKRRAKSGGAGSGAAEGGGGGGGPPTAEQLSGALQSPSQALLAGHTQCVAAVVWPTARTAVSGSWDHSVSPRDILASCLHYR